MKKLFANIVMTLIGLIIIAGVLAWPVYKFHDCKRVGHSTFYCVMDIG